ncbi:hypothetical protein Mgra_00005023 [Meloidogyne graminicola]|uniref:Uncharacterized protein n=1 Tax=Meloidogyne graminicola TaxID=189291 RepID=A0A8S9ZQC9_9BILA|nr:hypothetical protein Mgra_00005023 [Meloidogyne graminicola]
MPQKIINNSNNNIPSLIPLKIVSGTNLTTSTFEPQKSQKNLKQQKMILNKNEGKQKIIIPKKLIDSDNRPLNKTFTFSKPFNNKEEDKFRKNRSNSFDSDFVDFSGRNGKLRIRVEQTSFAMDWNTNNELIKGRKKLKNSNSNTFPRDKSEKRREFNNKKNNNNKDSTPKLPSLEGFLPGRTCCQLQFCRFSNLELLKYKRNLMKN